MINPLTVYREAHRDLQSESPQPAQYRPRQSSIAGLMDNAIRHTDGSFSRIYHLPLRPSMLQDDEVSDRRCQDLASLLTTRVPAGTILQFRYGVGPDPGASIAAHLRSRDYERVHRRAAFLHDTSVDYYRGLCEAGAFRRERAFLCVRCPTESKKSGLDSGFIAFLPAFLRDLKAMGLRHFSDASAYAWERTRRSEVVRRLEEEEAQALASAEKIFHRVELNGRSLEITALAGRELWEALWSSHVLNRRQAPILPSTPGLDVRPYLTSESLDDRGWYIRHGDYPLSIVSMFSPGESGPAIDLERSLSLRLITASSTLTFPHTIISEFLTLDPRQAKRRLLKRMGQVERAKSRGDRTEKKIHEADRALADLNQLLTAIAGGREALVQLRFYVVVYGERSRTRLELEESLKGLETRREEIVNALQSIEGVEAAPEEAAALYCLYPQTLLGEATARPTGREITEVASSLSAYIPLETAWGGSPRPHTLLRTVSGRLPGFDLWDRSTIKSPLVLILGEPGSGKSTFSGRLINDALGSVPNLRVHAVDVGGSLAPHAEVVGARYFRFDEREPKAINIWDYPELYEGETAEERMASSSQIALIVMDAAALARCKSDDEVSTDILTKAVRQVIADFVPRNGPGREHLEPTLSYLIQMLGSYDFGHRRLNERAAEIALALEKYANDPWLDQPTHPDYKLDSPYDVYELESLDTFPEDLRLTLSNRVGARTIRAIGRLTTDQWGAAVRHPALLVFEEVHKYDQYYPGLKRVIAKGARQGRKENAVTMLVTQTYDDFEGMHDVTATAGMKMIGKQTGDITSLIKDARLPEPAVDAIHSIKNVDGEYTQWVLAMGSGRDQTIEMVENRLSPVELWTFTTNANERNARAQVQALRPDWTMQEVVSHLAARYPRGLQAEGLTAIDQS